MYLYNPLLEDFELFLFYKEQLLPFCLGFYLCFAMLLLKMRRYCVDVFSLIRLFISFSLVETLCILRLQDSSSYTLQTYSRYTLQTYSRYTLQTYSRYTEMETLMKKSIFFFAHSMISFTLARLLQKNLQNIKLFLIKLLMYV